MKKDQVKKLLDPIADGLFGKQRTTRYERPNFPLRPLGMMLRDLAAIPDADWCRYAFSSEPLNGKFTDAQRTAYAEESRACGQEYARRLAQEFGTREPEKIARALHMEVSYPQYPEKTDRVLFAEFREPRSIRIYMDAVNRARTSLQEPGVREVLTD